MPFHYAPKHKKALVNHQLIGNLQGPFDYAQDCTTLFHSLHIPALRLLSPEAYGHASKGRECGING